MTLSEDTRLEGQVLGDAVVAPGVRLEVHGTVMGSLTVEVDAVVEVRGTLGDGLVNYGRCEVWGVIHGPIYDEERGVTRLHSGAVHDSDVST